jgi:Family of unknown function (DUF6325)
VPDRPGDRGPVQVVVIGYAGGSFDGGVLDQIGRLCGGDAVRLLDLLFVARDRSGEVIEIQGAEGSAEMVAARGDLVRALFGADGMPPEGSSSSGEDVWFLADEIPTGTAAAVAVLEHRWAAPLRDAIESAAGHDLVDRWIHPDDLPSIDVDLG